MKKTNPMTRVGIAGLSLCLAASGCALSAASDGAARTLSLADREVALIRDTYGTPHLYAEREEDAFYGLGYAYGEDRLEQVLAAYLRLQGRLAEKFGSGPLKEKTGVPIARAVSVDDTVKSDAFVRQFRFLDDARSNFGKLPPQLQRNMQQFVRGLEKYMADNPDRVPDWAPDLEPALPIAQMSLMTMLEFARFCDARLPSALVKTANLEMPNQGSNAWVAGGSRTEDGAVYFSSDSHGALELDFGTLFYNWRMKAGNLDVLSFDVAGSASFFFAHSSHYGWGWTEGKRSVADCYAVKTGPGRPDTYAHDDTVRTIKSLPYEISIKGEAARTGVFEYTDHNGVLSPVIRREGDVAYVVSSPYFGRSGLAAGTYYRMATATNREQFTKALSEREIYSANLLAGGADGLLLFIRPGRIPIRKPGVNAEQLLDGNTSKTAWLGVHGYDDLLKLVNPPQDYIANANVSPDRMYNQSPLRAEDYPSYYGFDVGLTGKRQLRFNEILDEARDLTVDQALGIVMDEKMQEADRWAPAFISAIKRQKTYVATLSAPARQVLDTLASFDGRFNRDSIGALHYALLRGELTMRWKADVDAIVLAIEGGAPLSPSQERTLMSAAAAVADDLLRAHGHVDLTYGRLHQMGRGSNILPVGGASFFGGYDLPGYPRQKIGDEHYAIMDTIRQMVFDDGRVPTTRKVTMHAGQRIPYFVAFTQPLQSFSSLYPGISERPDSPHYSDQIRLASDGRLKSSYFHLSDLLRNKLSIRRLDAREVQ